MDKSGMLPLRRAKGDDKRVARAGTGRGLAFSVPHGAGRQVAPDRLALKPYWGKPAVRNFRGVDGDVGIIRSPLRAISPPDTMYGCLSLSTSTAQGRVPSQAGFRRSTPQRPRK